MKMNSSRKKRSNNHKKTKGVKEGFAFIIFLGPKTTHQHRVNLRKRQGGGGWVAKGACKRQINRGVKAST